MFSHLWGKKGVNNLTSCIPINCIVGFFWVEFVWRGFPIWLKFMERWKLKVSPHKIPSNLRFRWCFRLWLAIGVGPSLEETKRFFLDFEMPNIDVNESTICRFLTYAQHASRFSLSFFHSAQPCQKRVKHNSVRNPWKDSTRSSYVDEKSLTHHGYR